MTPGQPSLFHRSGALLLAAALVALPRVLMGSPPEALREGWQIQSSCVANASGAEIASLGYRPKGWLPALVPGTVLGSQVQAGIFPDPFFGRNLRNIPGTDYPIGKIFGYLPMSATSPYRCSWWYRKEFEALAAPGRATWLRFNGINSRANIWLNGRQLADSDHVAGAFRRYAFDISSALHPSGHNVVAIEVFSQTEKDLGIDFLDWNPAPADKSMGLWRDVSLAQTGLVQVSNPAVLTHFTQDDLSEAELTVIADLQNSADHAVTTEVLAETANFAVRQQVTLQANESRAIAFKPSDYPQLRLHRPRVWWPYQFGDPHLETLRVKATADGKESDSQTINFGVREVQSSLNAAGALQFRINGRDILIRGAGWTPDLFYREPKERLRQELAYVRHMHLNAIRLEGKLGDDAMFDIADATGILILAGWQCCDYWQQWDKWTPADHAIAKASTYSQISRLRAHPSLLVWLNGSDETPPRAIEEEALDVLRERQWPNPVLSSAADRSSPLTGKTGVKMSGPYDYVPPEYWYLDKDRFGGAFGFNTETGPGPAIPTVSTIERTLPQASWWPGSSEKQIDEDENWKYHAGLGKFAQYSRFNAAMRATYGPSASLEDYSRKAQVMAYDGERAMFEAYRANQDRSTGVIQWMLNNAWPSFIWHLYDYYLIPGGGYFGTRKANELIHVQYNYSTRTVAAVNSTLELLHGLQLEANVYDLNGKQLFGRGSALNLNANSEGELFPIPAQSGTTFLKLELRDAEHRLLSENLYWIPAKLAQMDWDKTTYVNTPAIAYAGMTDLSALPPAQVQAKAILDPEGGSVSVHLDNRGAGVAFFLYLRAVKKGKEQDIAPIFWDDNFITLLPEESRTLHLSGISASDIDLEIRLTGWNAKAVVVPLERITQHSSGIER